MCYIKREHTAGLQGSDRLTEKVDVSQSGEDADVAATFFDNVARCCGRQLISVQTINGSIILGWSLLLSDSLCDCNHQRLLFTNSIVWTLTTSLNGQASASASGPGAFACGAHFVQWICLPDHSGVYRSLVQRVTPVEGVRLFAFRIS